MWIPLTFWTHFPLYVIKLVSESKWTVTQYPDKGESILLTNYLNKQSIATKSKQFILKENYNYQTME